MVLSIEQVYQEILDKKRKQFPSGTWSNDQYGRSNFVRCFRYLLEKMEWGEEEIKKHLSNKFLSKNRLSTPMIKYYGKNLYAALKEAYPKTAIKHWELEHSQVYWNDELAIEAVRWLIEEKLHFSKEDIIHHLIHEHFNKHRLSGLISHHFNNKIYLAIQNAYPDEDWTDFFNRKAQTLKRKQTNVENGKKVSSRVRKLTDEDVRRIRKLKNKIDVKELSESYNVHSYTIRSIWNGKLHADK